MNFLHITWISLFLVVLISILQKGEATLRITTEPGEYFIQPGESLRLSCTIDGDEGEAFDPFSQQIEWYKRQGDMVNDETVIIASMQNLRDPYSVAPQRARFSIDIARGDPVTSTLVIQNLEPRDSGTYTCRLISGENVQIEHHVYVIQPIQLVEIFAYPNAANRPADGEVATPVNSNEITFIRGVAGYVRCDVTGGYPEPNIRLKIGNSFNDGQGVNFPMSPSNECEWTGDIESLRVPLCHPYAINQNFRPEADQVGKRLMVMAAVENHDFPAILFSSQQAFITLGLAGTAEFIEESCASTQRGRPGNRFATIHCEFHSLPAPSRILWRLNSTMGIINGQDMNEYSASEWEDQGDGRFKVKLTIADVGTHHLHQYTINITNEYGSVARTIALIEGGESDRKNGGKEATQARVSGGAIAAIVIVPIVVIVLAVLIIVFLVKKSRQQAGAQASKPARGPYDNDNYQESPGPGSMDPRGQGKPTPAPRQPAPPNNRHYSNDFDRGFTDINYGGGQADLGMKALSGSVPGLNESMDSLGNPRHHRSRDGIDRMPRA